MTEETAATSTPDTPAGGPAKVRSLLTWAATGLIVYELVSGALIAWLPFGVIMQHAILWHTAIGLVSFAPLLWVVLRHRQRRRGSIAGREVTTATLALALLVVCLLSGLLVTIEAALTRSASNFGRLVHELGSVALAFLFGWHLLSVALARRKVDDRTRRGLYASIAAAIALLPIVAMLFITQAHRDDLRFQAFPEDYDWAYGEDRPFWPSRAGLAGAPWQRNLLDTLEEELGATDAAAMRAVLELPLDGGPSSQLRAVAAAAGWDEQHIGRLERAARDAVAQLPTNGALRPEAMTGSAGCGSSGCHEDIYKEWQASAHGYSAIDTLFVRVQALLAETRGVAETRSCAGCHDPVALLSGARTGTHGLTTTFEGNSCLVCHRTVSTDTEGNGGYVIEPPERYLYEQASGGAASLVGKFLIRSAPQAHVEMYSRDLYRSSDFCAACHKQLPAPGESTAAGLAQEQNEYDSWKASPWYHGDEHPDTIDCRECHMLLVDSQDPASGDRHDYNRSPGDGKHRSHRMLASNMYIPATMDIPGGEEQAALTISWLKGEIDVPEISHKWTTGPVVELEILAPDEIRAGDLVNLKLHLRNNKTGHDFPAGPLDVLESWIELSVEDDQGNTLMQLGHERSVSPAIDAPVIYKADWYDKQGLPVERHNLWDVVGASYRRIIRSGGEDIVDVPFRCPGIARPRLSDSVAETDPGGRRSDVVFAIENAQVNALKITARLLFRKANPEFLASVYDFEPVTEAPVIELVRKTKTVRVVQP